MPGRLLCQNDEGRATRLRLRDAPGPTLPLFLTLNASVQSILSSVKDFRVKNRFVAKSRLLDYASRDGPRNAERQMSSRGTPPRNLSRAVFAAVRAEVLSGRL